MHYVLIIHEVADYNAWKKCLITLQILEKKLVNVPIKF